MLTLLIVNLALVNLVNYLLKKQKSTGTLISKVHE